MSPTDNQVVPAASLMALARPDRRKRLLALTGRFLLAIMMIAVHICIIWNFRDYWFLVLVSQTIIIIGLPLIFRLGTRASNDNTGHAGRVKVKEATPPVKWSPQACQRYAETLSKMTEDDLACLSRHDVDLLADAIHEDSRQLELAALAALRSVGGVEHLHSVNLLVLKLRLELSSPSPARQRDDLQSVLELAESCAEVLRSRVTFQKERETLLRASQPATADALLRPAGASVTPSQILMRPLAAETPLEASTSSLP